VARFLLASGVAALGMTAVWDPQRTLAVLLSSGLFVLQIALGGGIFIATQAAAGATWWRPIARVPLLLMRTLPVPIVVIGLVLFLGLETLYPWARTEVVEASSVVQAKAGWLNASFFLARAVSVFIIWLGFVAAFRRRLTEGGTSLRRTSILFLVTLAPTLSIAAWDWAMSLEPEWFSTMYGVYLFSSAFASGIAAVIVLSVWFEGTELVPRPVGAELLHDLGKLLFGFSCFWAYLWFCEFLLIWYANIPEEATHFVARQSGGWASLFWLHPVLCFAVPFVVLMPAGTKRSPGTLVQVALTVLAGQWLGAYLMVHPSLGQRAGFPLLAVLATAMLLAAMGLLARRLHST
jgi:hypothetical protein